MITGETMQSPSEINTEIIKQQIDQLNKSQNNYEYNKYNKIDYDQKINSNNACKDPPRHHKTNKHFQKITIIFPNKSPYNKIKTNTYNKIIPIHKQIHTNIITTH